MTLIGFDDKADELSKKYGMNRGQVYDIMKVTEIKRGISHIKELFRPETFYANVYKISEDKISAKQQSDLEKLSNEVKL